MPQYSGDQILQGGANVSDIARNYRRTDRSSNFGTRKLAFYAVTTSQDFGLAANYAENNSLFYQLVRAIQQGSFIGGPKGPYYVDGQIPPGGGGGAELFYVGTPQNSATSPLNQGDNYIGIRPLNTTNTITVVAASGNGTVATLTFASAQGTPPFNVGDPVQVNNVGSGYNCDLYQQHFVTECTTTYVKYNSTATANLVDIEGGVYADLGYDCFTFAIVDDAEPLLPASGDSVFGDLDYTGVAGDSECFCCNGGRQYSTITPVNFSLAISQVLADNDLANDFSIYRLKDSFGIINF